VSEVTFEQASARHRIEAVPYAQLSIELGHLYHADYAAGTERFREMFAAVSPWYRAAVESARATGRRISTCYLVDDYLLEPESPKSVLPALTEAAREFGVPIDYLARESACAEAGDVSIARILTGALVPEPAPGTNGSRPSPALSGWLTNARKGTSERLQAMAPVPPWTPPRQHVPDRHSICLDVELWDEQDGERTYSCAFLAACWQLLRLGLLRDGGLALLTPESLPDELPDQWRELPPVVRLSERPAPFAAYRTLSILPGRFLPVEAAVRMILDQTAFDPVVVAQSETRAAAEGLDQLGHATRRLRYVFV
jgi:hypothetical protein